MDFYLHEKRLMLNADSSWRYSIASCLTLVYNDATTLAIGSDS